MVRLLTLFVFIMLPFQEVLALATAKLDRLSIIENESVILTIELDKRSSNEPDLSPLNGAFKVIGQSKSSSTQIINNQRSASTTWIYRLAPLTTGLITIAPISVDGEKTETLNLEVRQLEQSTHTSNDPIFIDVQLNKTEAQVQEQILLTFKLHSQLRFREASLSEIEIEGAKIELAEQQSYQEMINGKPYQTDKLVYAIFPQQSGTMEIPKLVFSGYPTRNNLGLNQRITLASSDYSVEIRPIPADNIPYWIPASSLQLTDKWSKDLNDIKEGDALTRTILIRVEGLTAEQLPDFDLTPESNQYKVYAEPAERDNANNDQGFTGSIKLNYTYIFTHSGNIIIPDISIPWWNTQTNQLETVKLSGKKLKVIPLGNKPQPAQPSSPYTETEAPTTEEIVTQKPKTAVKQNGIWPILAGVFFLSTLTLGFMLMAQRKAIKHNLANTEKSANNHSDLKSACQKEDLDAVRRLLIAWAKDHWRGHTVHSLQDIIKACEDEELNTLIALLEEKRYKNPNSKLDMMNLYNAHKRFCAKSSKQKKAALKPLYPN